MTSVTSPATVHLSSDGYLHLVISGMTIVLGRAEADVIRRIQLAAERGQQQVATTLNSHVGKRRNKAVRA